MADASNNEIKRFLCLLLCLPKVIGTIFTEYSQTSVQQCIEEAWRNAKMNRVTADGFVM